jgi:hypothetical protein
MNRRDLVLHRALKQLKENATTLRRLTRQKLTEQGDLMGLYQAVKQLVPSQTGEVRQHLSQAAQSLFQAVQLAQRGPTLGQMKRDRVGEPPAAQPMPQPR